MKKGFVALLGIAATFHAAAAVDCTVNTIADIIQIADDPDNTRRRTIQITFASEPSDDLPALTSGGLEYLAIEDSAGASVTTSDVLEVVSGATWSATTTTIYTLSVAAKQAGDFTVACKDQGGSTITPTAAVDMRVQTYAALTLDEGASGVSLDGDEYSVIVGTDDTFDVLVTYGLPLSKAALVTGVAGMTATPASTDILSAYDRGAKTTKLAAVVAGTPTCSTEGYTWVCKFACTPALAGQMDFYSLDLTDTNVAATESPASKINIVTKMTLSLVAGTATLDGTNSIVAVETTGSEQYTVKAALDYDLTSTAQSAVAAVNVADSLTYQIGTSDPVAVGFASVVAAVTGSETIAYASQAITMAVDAVALGKFKVTFKGVAGILAESDAFEMQHQSTVTLALAASSDSTTAATVASPVVTPATDKARYLIEATFLLPLLASADCDDDAADLLTAGGLSALIQYEEGGSTEITTDKPVKEVTDATWTVSGDSKVYTLEVQAAFSGKFQLGFDADATAIATVVYPATQADRTADDLDYVDSTVFTQKNVLSLSIVALAGGVPSEDVDADNHVVLVTDSSKTTYTVVLTAAIGIVSPTDASSVDKSDGVTDLSATATIAAWGNANTDKTEYTATATALQASSVQFLVAELTDIHVAASIDVDQVTGATLAADSTGTTANDAVVSGSGSDFSAITTESGKVNYKITVTLALAPRTEATLTGIAVGTAFTTGTAALSTLAALAGSSTTYTLTLASAQAGTQTIKLNAVADATCHIAESPEIKVEQLASVALTADSGKSSATFAFDPSSTDLTYPITATFTLPLGDATVMTDVGIDTTSVSGADGYVASEAMDGTATTWTTSDSTIFEITAKALKVTDDTFSIRLNAIDGVSTQSASLSLEQTVEASLDVVAADSQSADVSGSGPYVVSVPETSTNNQFKLVVKTVIAMKTAPTGAADLVAGNGRFTCGDWSEITADTEYEAVCTAEAAGAETLQLSTSARSTLGVLDETTTDVNFMAGYAALKFVLLYTTDAARLVGSDTLYVEAAGAVDVGLEVAFSLPLSGDVKDAFVALGIADVQDKDAGAAQTNFVAQGAGTGKWTPVDNDATYKIDGEVSAAQAGSVTLQLPGVNETYVTTEFSVKVLTGGVLTLEDITDEAATSGAGATWETVSTSADEDTYTLVVTPFIPMDAGAVASITADADAADEVVTSEASYGTLAAFADVDSDGSKLTSVVTIAGVGKTAFDFNADETAGSKKHFLLKGDSSAIDVTHRDTPAVTLLALDAGGAAVSGDGSDSTTNKYVVDVQDAEDGEKWVVDMAFHFKPDDSVINAANNANDKLSLLTFSSQLGSVVATGSWARSSGNVNNLRLEVAAASLGSGELQAAENQPEGIRAVAASAPSVWYQVTGTPVLSVASSTTSNTMITVNVQFPLDMPSPQGTSDSPVATEPTSAADDNYVIVADSWKQVSNSKWTFVVSPNMTEDSGNGTFNVAYAAVEVANVSALPDAAEQQAQTSVAVTLAITYKPAVQVDFFVYDAEEDECVESKSLTTRTGTLRELVNTEDSAHDKLCMRLTFGDSSKPGTGVLNTDATEITNAVESMIGSTSWTAAAVTRSSNNVWYAFIEPNVTATGSPAMVFGTPTDADLVPAVTSFDDISLTPQSRVVSIAAGGNLLANEDSELVVTLSHPVLLEAGTLTDLFYIADVRTGGIGGSITAITPAASSSRADTFTVTFKPTVGSVTVAVNATSGKARTSPNMVNYPRNDLSLAYPRSTLAFPVQQAVVFKGHGIATLDAPFDPIQAADDTAKLGGAESLRYAVVRLETAFELSSTLVSDIVNGKGPSDSYDGTVNFLTSKDHFDSLGFDDSLNAFVYEMRIEFWMTLSAFDISVRTGSEVLSEGTGSVSLTGIDYNPVLVPAFVSYNQDLEPVFLSEGALVQSSSLYLRVMFSGFKGQLASEDVTSLLSSYGFTMSDSVDADPTTPGTVEAAARGVNLYDGEFSGVQWLINEFTMATAPEESEVTEGGETFTVPALQVGQLAVRVQKQNSGSALGSAQPDAWTTVRVAPEFTSALYTTGYIVAADGECTVKNGATPDTPLAAFSSSTDFDFSVAGDVAVFVVVEVDPSTWSTTTFDNFEIVDETAVQESVQGVNTAGVEVYKLTTNKGYCLKLDLPNEAAEDTFQAELLTSTDVVRPAASMLSSMEGSMAKPLVNLAQPFGKVLFSFVSTDVQSDADAVAEQPSWTSRRVTKVEAGASRVRDATDGTLDKPYVRVSLQLVDDDDVRRAITVTDFAADGNSLVDDVVSVEKWDADTGAWVAATAADYFDGWATTKLRFDDSGATDVLAASTVSNAWFVLTLASEAGKPANSDRIRFVWSQTTTPKLLTTADESGVLYLERKGCMLSSDEATDADDKATVPSVCTMKPKALPDLSNNAEVDVRGSDGKQAVKLQIPPQAFKLDDGTAPTTGLELDLGAVDADQVEDKPDASSTPASEFVSIKVRSTGGQAGNVDPSKKIDLTFSVKESVVRAFNQKTEVLQAFYKNADSLADEAPWLPLPDSRYNPSTGQVEAKTNHFTFFGVFKRDRPRDMTPGGGCDNACSGHGNCLGQGECACWSGWQGWDCSERTCAYGTAWAVDHDEDAHYYAECSNKGTCDRETGECVCVEGYTGRACSRQTCPNGCSGHGKCQTVDMMSEVGAVYAGWDGDMVASCECDGGFFGPDCSQRYCPFGDDPLTQCNPEPENQVQKITFTFAKEVAAADVTGQAPRTDEAAFFFRDVHGEVWNTQRVSDLWGSNGASNLESALENLPNFVADGVSVSRVTGTSDWVREFKVTFSGESVTGRQALLMCPDEIMGELGCQTAGCQPMFKQLRVVQYTQAGGAQAGDVTVTEGSVLRRLGEQNTNVWDVTFEVEVAVSTDADANSFRYRVKEGADAFGAWSAWELIPNQLNSVELERGVFVAFASRKAPAGTTTIEYAVPTCSVSESTAASVNAESAECSNRGNCNRESGSCECFAGYSGLACGQQSILI